MWRASEKQLVEVLHAIVPSFHWKMRSATPDDEADVDALENAFKLHCVRRYFHQVYWRRESEAAASADIFEPDLKLENVAAHSWHVADAVLLFADRFDNLCGDRALRLAILHDKLEIYTGDFDPVGASGEGKDTHAFDPTARVRKALLEQAALKEYLGLLRPSAREKQEALIEENLAGVTAEARFVKAVDKLQALAFVNEKKQGDVFDAHLLFSLRYSLRALEFFPDLSGHYLCLAGRFLQKVAERRHLALEALLAQLGAPSAVDRRFGGTDGGN
jgi:5'-deoxynucleotidase YfbR-like HD superfamily hydrolase